MAKDVRIIPHILVARDTDRASSLLFSVSVGVAADIVEWSGDDRVGSDTLFSESDPPYYLTQKLGDWLSIAYSFCMNDALMRVAFFEGLGLNVLFDDVIEVHFERKVFFLNSEADIKKLKLSGKSIYRSFPRSPSTHKFPTGFS